MHAQKCQRASNVRQHAFDQTLKQHLFYLHFSFTIRYIFIFQKMKRSSGMRYVPLLKDYLMFVVCVALLQFAVLYVCAYVCVYVCLQILQFTTEELWYESSKNTIIVNRH